MMIDKINSINPLNNVQNTKRASGAGNAVQAGPDEINVSQEARRLADAYYLDSVAKETPDVRAELVEEIKQKIQDPNYLSESRIAAAADAILLAYGL